MATFSIITVSYNAVSTIADCLSSVRDQAFPAEHVVIDGGSTDGTLDVICDYPHVGPSVSEPDNGIYDAMNKGLLLATGDIIGILNADDLYVDEHVLRDVAQVFEEREVDSVFADLVFVKPDDLNKVVRHYRADKIRPSMFAYGWMPPHPTFFCRCEVYEKYGVFKTDYQIAADYELLTRFLACHRISYHHLPKVIVKMRTGGVSTRGLRSNVVLNREIVRACRENGIRTNAFKVYSKYFSKLFQLISRPS